jgi:hypothetical protein
MGLAILALPHPRQTMPVCQQYVPRRYPRQLALFCPFRKGRRTCCGAAAVPQNGGPSKRKLAMLKPWQGKRSQHVRRKKRAGYN